MITGKLVFRDGKIRVMALPEERERWNFPCSNGTIVCLHRVGEISNDFVLYSENGPGREVFAEMAVTGELIARAEKQLIEQLSLMLERVAEGDGFVIERDIPIRLAPPLDDLKRALEHSPHEIVRVRAHATAVRKVA